MPRRAGQDGPVTTDHGRWNHNIRCHRLILDSVPAGGRDALDAGCGEGMLARRLRRIVPDVVAIDRDQPSI
jgi:2-polyprenyl-3-methyl-5-hydroxy-6-metoxy-1,4-benzoquinol methylase